MTIPRIIHHVWPGDDLIPHRYRAYRDTWRAHHPGWEHRLWTPTEIDGLDMINADLYDRAVELAPDDWLRWRADIARLEILYRHGGIYVDTDTECLRPCDDLCRYSCWFAESPNAPGRATQAVCGAEPEHPFIGRLLDVMATSAGEHATRRINHRVGSAFVDRELQEWSGPAGAGRRPGYGVAMLPARWFAAQSIKGRRAGATPTIDPEAFCWHHYDNSARHETARVVAAFRDLADLLNDAEIDWFLTSGLLLGHVRDGAVIPWDGDLDIGIWPADIGPVREVFADAGWRATRDRPSQFWPYHPNGTKVDIHTHYHDPDRGTVFKLHGKAEKIRMDHPAHLFEHMTRSMFYLRRVAVPSPPEEYLEVMYGPGWLTPTREWQWDRSPHNITRL